MQVPAAPAVDDITPPGEVQQIVAVVAALLAENDHATCLAFVNSKCTIYASEHVMSPHCFSFR